MSSDLSMESDMLSNAGLCCAVRPARRGQAFVYRLTHFIHMGMSRGFISIDFFHVKPKLDLFL